MQIDEKQPLNPHGGKIGALNQTHDEEHTTDMMYYDDEVAKMKKWKKIKLAIIGGGVALFVLTITLVLVLTLGKGGNNPPGPSPPGP
jgi:hypothetical protein